MSDRFVETDAGGFRFHEPGRPESLLESESDEWISAKIKKLVGEGYGRDQAVAIAYHMGGRSRQEAEQYLESVVTVHRADGTTYQQHRQDGKDKDARGNSGGSEHKMPDEHVLGGLAEKAGDAARDPGVWAKVKDKALTVAAKVYGKLLTATPAAVRVLGAIQQVVDTPDDLKKIGYNPTVSSGVAGHETGDPVRAATGISAHLAATIASHVLAKAIVYVKGKLAGGKTEAEQGDAVAEAAGVLAEVLGVIAEELGLPKPDPEAVRAAVEKLAAGK